MCRIGILTLLLAAGTLQAQFDPIVGTTWYDLQHNGSHGKMIAVSSDGIIHGSFMGGINATGGRRVQAWCVDQEQNLIAGPTDVLSERTGYTTHAVTSDAPPNGLAPNSGVVGFHTVGGSWLGVDFSGCSMAFNTLQETESVDILWPHIAVDYQDRVHMVCGDASTGEHADAVWYNASTNGLAWDSTYALVTESSSTLSQIVSAAKRDPGAAVLFMIDAPASSPGYGVGTNYWHHDICYLEARDADNDLFAQIAGTQPFNITCYNDIVSPAPFRFGVYAYADMDAIYDMSESPNLLVAFSTPVSMPDTMLHENLADHVTQSDGWINVNPWQSAIWFHNATTGAWGHIAGWLSADGETELPDSSMRLDVFRCASDRVQLAHDPETGLLYALWNEFSIHDMRAPDGGQSKPNGELLLACSDDGGLTWGPRVNITNTPSPGCVMGTCWSETCASLAEVVDNGYLHLTFLRDTYAGVDVGGPNITLNNVYYKRISTVSVPPPNGQPWDAAGHIGLGSYRRPWGFITGHPDSARVTDRVAIFNEGRTERRLVDLVVHHDSQDLLGDASSDLWARWGVLRGDPVEPQGWITDPAGSTEWDGLLPAQRVTLTELSIGHRGLPSHEQAFSFHFDDGTVRVYRFVYAGPNNHGSRVEPIDLEHLEQYAADTLYHNEALQSLPSARPAGIALLTASPNPFNPATEIAFSLAAPAEVWLTVFNLRGEVVARLVDGALPAGEHRVRFSGEGLACGVYLAALEAGGRRESIKLLLAK